MSAGGTPETTAGREELVADSPASLLGVRIRGGRARRFPDGLVAADPAGPAPDRAPEPAPPPVSGAPARPAAAGTVADAGPDAAALLAQWRGWRSGRRLPALGRIEGRMASLCPGGVLLAVRGERIEVAKRLPGPAPAMDVAALEWIRAVARDAANRAAPRHELDEAAALGLLALPFLVEGADSRRASTAVLCRIYALESEPARATAAPGFFTGMLRRIAGI